MRILVMGAGVIGSVYAGRLLDAGHTVTLCARGRRLAELQDNGLILEDASTGRRTARRVRAVASPDAGMRCDLVLVAVRREQIVATVPLVRDIEADVMFFGNAAGLTATLSAATGDRTLFGFPAAAGLREGNAVRYGLIRQQKTMLSDPNGRRSPRVTALAKVFDDAGFSASITDDAEGWLTAHAAFIVPIAFALYQVGVEPRRLAADRALLTTMVRATRQGFVALRVAGNRQIPSNLRWLYLRLPEPVAVHYWRAALRGLRGELWFAAHARAAPAEMASLATALRSAVDRSGRRAPDLDALREGAPESLRGAD